MEVSVVIPCLNEAATIAGCVRQALQALASGQLDGEVIVADNGSTDGSRELAAQAGARVVPVANRGYGNALMAGIEAAHGRYVIMGDADGSYDFGMTPQFVARLREGHDLVQGCRLPAGGGTIAPGAMPWLHRWFGNPALTALARLMFRTQVRDIYCGLRGFTKEFYYRMNLRCTGMEFATEMIIKAAKYHAPRTEIPITLHKDGRGGRRGHLRTFRDGWRTLRLFLLYSPRWVFLIPSTFLIVFGLIAAACAFLGLNVGGLHLGAHTLLVAGVSLLLGHQGLLLGLFTATFARRENLAPPSELLERFYRHFTLERGLLAAGVSALLGIIFIGAIFLKWRATGYGLLEYSHTLRYVVVGGTLLALSAQTVFASFATSLIGLPRK